jgi:hypothetical protein
VFNMLLVTVELGFVGVLLEVSIERRDSHRRSLERVWLPTCVARPSGVNASPLFRHYAFFKDTRGPSAEPPADTSAPEIR